MAEKCNYRPFFRTEEREPPCAARTRSRNIAKRQERRRCCSFSFQSHPLFLFTIFFSFFLNQRRIGVCLLDGWLYYGALKWDSCLVVCRNSWRACYRNPGSYLRLVHFLSFLSRLFLNCSYSFSSLFLFVIVRGVNGHR